ncbi:MAG: aryl-sulfate sulfotransferase [Saprospiraceae bacterium]|nr:aryl-sulfate sulfotransferase [Saprospiraceae bacterium]
MSAKILGIWSTWSMRNGLLTMVWVFMFSIGFSQNHTVGLLSFDPDRSFPGFNLVFPHNQSTVFLLNNCGQFVQSWTDEANFRPGNAVYLREDGTLLKTKREADSNLDPIWFGGGGEIVEIRGWDNSLLWSFSLNDSLARLHHDVTPLPNGNILMIAWELRTREEAIMAGRDPDLLTDDDLLPEYIFEMDPAQDSIVWEWRVWDHLIQDYDGNKENFGVVHDHPELIDLNFDTNNGIRDWLHCNAIDYNAELDQIMLCIPTFGEVWIIDHSTTSVEAAGHSGGRSGRGGDLLYRWGNPQTYRQGDAEDQILFFPHDAHWVDRNLKVDHPDYGKILIFNNRINELYSTVELLNPIFDSSVWNYSFSEDSLWWSIRPDKTIMHPDTFSLHSTAVSSAQILNNENILILSGRTGYAFELTPDGSVVWEYKVPLAAGKPVAQGDTLATNQNFTFRLNRYPEDFAAFENRDLSSRGFIELEPDSSYCDQILPAIEIDLTNINIFPNPVQNHVTIVSNIAHPVSIEVSDLIGHSLYSDQLTAMGEQVISTTDWPSALYLVRINGIVTSKILVVD